MSVPNQKLILIDREKVNTVQKGRRFLMVYTDNINMAYNIMNGEKCFGLYLYLLECMPHFYNEKPVDNMPPKFELSGSAIQDELGMTKPTYQRSIDKLIELGFLKHIKGNLYYFYEMPQQYRVKTYEEYKHEEELKEISIEEAQKILKNRQDEELKRQIIQQQLNMPTDEVFRAPYDWETTEEYIQKKRQYELSK